MCVCERGRARRGTQDWNKTRHRVSSFTTCHVWSFLSPSIFLSFRWLSFYFSSFHSVRAYIRVFVDFTVVVVGAAVVLCSRHIPDFNPVTKICSWLWRDMRPGEKRISFRWFWCSVLRLSYWRSIKEFSDKCLQSCLRTTSGSYYIYFFCAIISKNIFEATVILWELAA